MSDIRNFRKGVAYSVIAIVAMVGVLAVLGGLSYQSSVGTGVATSDATKLNQDASTQKLEFTKAMVLQGIRYSTLSSTMDVTKNGGTTDAETYWTCNNVAQPVTPLEFKAAISNVSLQNMGAYVESLKKEQFLADKSVTLSDPDCMSTAYIQSNTEVKDVSSCDHLTCDYLGSGIVEETLGVSSPVRTNYQGSLNVNDVGPIRAANTLRVLDDLFQDNKILSLMQTSMAAECPEPTAVKFEIAYKDVCAEIKKKLDPENPEYILCNMTEIPAPHTDCIRAKKEGTCLSSISLQSGNEKAALIHIDDLKYEPLGDGNHMEWNVKMSYELDEPECTPING